MALHNSSYKSLTKGVIIFTVHSAHIQRGAKVGTQL